MRELIVDNFAGGGGASTGIELALGISPDIAINHDAVALAMHEANHPATRHLCTSVWKVDPDEIEGPIGLGWFSPDCKHFSKAKGGKPVEKGIRDLTWVVVRWARRKAGGPRVIILENVEEFRTWGPLGEDGRPCPLRKGATFKRWVGELKRLGYTVDWRELRACDYGAPTIRKRLFLIARRDGEPIVWPAPTHGDPTSEAVRDGRLKPWRTAAEIIDWSLPCHSIFLTPEEAKAIGVRRPLADATMARIAKGVRRYVLDAARPYVVNLTHHGDGQMQDIAAPLATVTAAHRGEKALVAPFVTGCGGRMAQTEPRGADQPMQTLTAKADSVLVTPFVSAAQQGGSVRDAADPLHTVTASHKDQNQIVTPFLTKFRPDSAGASIEDPAPTVTANSFIKRPGGAAPIGIVAPYLVPRYGERPGQEPRTRAIDEPAPVVVPTGNGGSLVAAHLSTMRNADKPFSGAGEPTHTVTAGGARQALVAAFLAKHFGGNETPGWPLAQPISTVTAQDHHALVSAGLTLLKGKDRRDAPTEEPLPTICAEGTHIAETRAFLTKYYGADQDPRLDEPLHTATAKARFGLSTVTIEGEPYVITDIGMRMLSPRELFRAQGFPESYIIDRRPDGTPITKTDQVAKCGNSVCPPIAAALVAANFAPREIFPAPAEAAEFYLEAAE